MKEKIKNFLKRAIIKLKSPFFEILLGIAVISVICVVSYNFNKKELGYAMEQTSIYLKKQCLSFNRYDDAAVTRGIIRIIENVQQIVRNIDLRKSVTNKDLERYTFEQRLTGSFVLDEKNNIVCEYSSDYEDIENLKKYCLNNKSLLDTAKFLKKTYAIRLRNSDFSYVDVVAHGRKDCRGVVVGFYYTSAEYARNYNLNFQNFLEGYIPNSRLMIVVSSNTKIIASNERRLLDSSTKDNPLFKQVLLNKKNGDVVHVKTKKFDCFGIAENCRDFSIFIFAPVREMLKNILKTVLLSGFFYLFLLFIFYMARRRSAFIAELQQKKKEAFEIFTNSKEDEFSAVIMDIMMLEMDGLEATKKIRALPRSDAKKVPIIAMTANAFSDDRIKAFEAGMTDHLAKPIDSKTLVQMFEKYLPVKSQG